MKQTKKICSLFLALFCAASLFCASAFASESSTEGDGGYYSVDMRTQFKSIGSTSGYAFSSPVVSGDSVEISRAYSNDSSRRYGSYWNVVYELTVPYTAYYDIFTSGKSRWYQYDGSGNKVYIEANFSCTFGTSSSPSVKDWVAYSSWSTARKLNAGKYTLTLTYSLGTDSVFGENYNDLVVYAPQFRLSDNDFNKENVIARSAKDYFSAGKKAFFACPNCGTQMNQSYSSYVGFVYNNQSLECPSCGKVITNKSWMGGLVHKHSESGGDYQGTLDDTSPVQTPSGSTNIPQPDGTNKPMDYSNAYTQNNVTYIYGEDRVVEYYPSSLTGNGDVYVTYEYGGDTYITVQGYTPPACSHVYDDGVIEPAPTCTAPGKLTQTCTQCGDKKVSVLPTVSHSYGEGVREEATCIVSGTLTQTCTICGDQKITTIPNLGHDWQVKTTVNTQYGEDGTLIKQGYVLYECTRCGEQYKADSEGGQVTPPPSGGGSGGGSGENPGGGDGEKSIWEKLGEFLGTVLGGLLDVISGAFGKILDILTQIVTDLTVGLKTLVEGLLESFTTLLDFGGGFKDFLASFFSWLPPEIVALFVLSISLGIVLMIVKFIRG